MSQLSRFVVASAALALLALAATPAQADDRRRDDRRGQGWQEHEWREREWRDHRTYYAPPGAYYAPRAYTPPPLFGLTIR